MLAAIFEDDTFENFYPLTLIRPIFDLKCGPTTLYEKIVQALKPQKLCFFSRQYLTDVLKEKSAGAAVNDLDVLYEDDVLLINGRWLFIEDTKLSLEGPEEIGLLEEDDTVLYARIKHQTARSCTASTFEEFLQKVAAKVTTRKKLKADVIRYPWDLVVHNARAIVDDFNKQGNSGIEGDLHKSAALIGDESQIYIAPTAKIYPHVTIDTTDGPVTIEKGTRVDSGSDITGPAYIGPDNIILGAKVREGTALGPVCWVGGEIEETIAYGYLNKMHSGFLGHSYAGEGINLGADTTNSDIKNDFSNVSVHVKGGFVSTGQLKVGSFIGDYTKTSIGTLFNTGSSIGLLSVILGGDGVLPKFIPSFSWYINRKVTKGFGFNKLVEAANNQLVRRNRPLSEAEIAVLKEAYRIAKPQRDVFVKKDRMQ